MIMRRGAIAILMLASVAGCATRATTHGNFIDKAPPGYDQSLVKDVVQQLVAVYPPARTRFDLQQATPDAFGAALVAALRSKGYALQEFAAATPVPGKAALSTPAIPMRYVVDQAPGANLYRVSVYVGTQSLARAYLVQNDILVPAGAWSRRE